MELIEIRTYNSPNIYSCKEAIVKMKVKLGDYEEIPTKDISGFNKKILKIFPGLSMHKCSLGLEGGFVQRLSEGTYLAHVMEHTCLEVQNTMGFNVSYGKARKSEDDIYNVIFSCKNTAIGRMCGIFVYELFDEIINSKVIDFEKKYIKLTKACGKYCLGPSTLAIMEMAKKREIPVSEIDSSGILRLGFGKFQKLLSATLFQRTSCIAVDISCDKQLTKYILEEEGIPVPKGNCCVNLDEALVTAKKIEYPVVVKPKFGNHGKNVFMNINEDIELIHVVNNLLRVEAEVVVEKLVKGKDYRVLVVDGKFVAASERVPAHVVGDGKSTIDELINQTNQDVRRGEDHEKPLTKVKIDEACKKYIKTQGFQLKDIPKIDEIIWLKETANLSAGGTAIDSTELIHTKNKQICENAVKAIGLDIAGVDLKIPDISMPMDEDYGAIIEINAAPGIRMHLYPSEGSPRDVVSPILDMIYPKGEPNSVPIVCVTGTNGKTSTTRMIAYILQNSGLTVGKTTTGGIYINDECIEEGDTTGYYSTKKILNNSRVEAAVLEVARGGIIRNGLAYEKADVAVFTNLSSDHLGVDEINTLDELFHVKSLVLECVKENGCCVINADDLWAKNAMEISPGEIILYSLKADNPLMLKHIKARGRGVYRAGNSVFLVDKGTTKIMKVNEIAASREGKIIHNIYNSLAAIAASYALGTPLDIIEKSLKSFDTHKSHNPGRFNLYNMGKFNIILDYGHNEDGYKNTIDSLKNFSYKRLVGIVGVPGDRRCEDIRNIGAITGKHFDNIIIKEDSHLRGRKPSETANLLLDGALEAGAKMENIEIILSEKEAIKASIKNAVDGDLIVMFFEKFEPLVEIIESTQSSLFS